MPTSKKIPTIQDVARHASVSAASVSRALSSPERVSDDMKQRVQAAVRATGYTLNQAARSLRLRHTRTILVAVPNISNPFFSPILAAVEMEAAARGFGMLIANAGPDTESRQRLRNYFHSGRADGLLLLDGTMPAKVLREVFPDPDNVPVVVACEDVPGSGLCTVKTDNVEASERVANYLIEAGHERIAHVTGPAGNPLTAERLEGFNRAAVAHGLQVPPEYVVQGAFTIESGAEAAQRLMGLVHPPTAVFCANDETAIGLISRMRTMGISCPDDVSVTGFDDIEMAAHSVPPLTTVRQPKHELGRLAAEALLDRLEGGGATHPTRIVLKSELIVRGSVRPLPPVRGGPINT